MKSNLKKTQERKLKRAVKLIETSKGRFFGLKLKQGSVHNARFMGGTEHFLYLFDRNRNENFKVAKTSVAFVKSQGETVSINHASKNQ